MGGLDMNDIAVPICIIKRPRDVVYIFNQSVRWLFDGPICAFIKPASRDGDGGVTVGINDDLDSQVPQRCRQLCDEQLRTPVIGRRHRNEWRSDDADSQMQ